MKKYFFLCFIAAFVFACGGSDNTNTESNENASTQNPYAEGEGVESASEKLSEDPEGIGKHRNVELAPTLDKQLAAKGKEISEMKCLSCHRLTEERLVGPGWKGVTERRRPAFILNFITNVDEMIDKDKVAQGMLEVCMVRMPNQNLTDEEAYAVLEFMRQNDGVM